MVETGAGAGSGINSELSHVTSRVFNLPKYTKHILSTLFKHLDTLFTLLNASKNKISPTPAGNLSGYPESIKSPKHQKQKGLAGD